MTEVLGLHRTGSKVSIDSITSFAGSINTKKAYKTFCKNLYQIGVTSDMISQKQEEILSIFKPQIIASNGQMGDNDTRNPCQLPAVRDFVRYRY